MNRRKRMVAMMLTVGLTMTQMAGAFISYANSTPIVTSVKEIISEQNVLNAKEVRERLEDDYGIQANLNDVEEAITTSLDELAEERPAEIFSRVGNFIVTYSMLNKPVNDITFYGPHNAYANNEDSSSSYSADGKIQTKNQSYGIERQLNYGARFIDLDLGKYSGKFRHYHRVPTHGRGTYGDTVEAMDNFLDENPNEVIVIRITDYFKGIEKVDASEELLKEYLKAMDREGLLDKIYNYEGSDADVDNLLDYKEISYGDMVSKGKNIVFFARSFNNDNNIGRQGHGDGIHLIVDSDEVKPERGVKPFFMQEYFPDPDSAGSLKYSDQNNNGRRLYTFMNTLAENLTELNGRVKYPSLLSLDYIRNEVHDVAPVDAVSRLNLEHHAGGWEQYEEEGFYWTMDPLPGTNIAPEASLMNSNQGDMNHLVDGHPYNYIDDLDYSSYRADFTFDEPKRFSHVALNFFSFDMPNDYRIEVKDANGNWIKVTEGGDMDYHPGHAWQIIEIPESARIQGDSIRIRFSEDDDMYLSEIAIYVEEAADNTIEIRDGNLVDSYVRLGSYDDDNFGDSEKLVIKEQEGSRDKYWRHTFMKFNGNIPSTVKRATLKFYVRKNDENKATPLIAHSISNNWTESNITGERMFDIDGLYDRKHFVGGTVLFHDEGWYEMDLTSYIQECARENKVPNIRIDAFHSSDNAIEIYSSEYDNHSKRPVLSIEY